MLFGAAGLAFDVGRFYSERRFLQNAADAAALAAANSLIRGETPSQADARAREVLTSNFTHSPSGVTPSLPPTTPVYETRPRRRPRVADQRDPHLAAARSGWPSRTPVGYTFGRIVGLDQNTIGGQARALGRGNMLPIAVRRYVHLPGPTSGAAAPCPDDTASFHGLLRDGEHGLPRLRDEREPSGSIPRAGNAFDSANPGSNPAATGPIVAILGQGAQPNNGADFRGFIALDIRNFAAAGTQLYYNNVTAVDQLQHAQGVRGQLGDVGGYPGPQLPAGRHTARSQRPGRDDVDGNSTGIVIDAILNRFVPGEEVLIAVYPGNVMAIPDFTITAAVDDLRCRRHGHAPRRGIDEGLLQPAVPGQPGDPRRRSLTSATRTTRSDRHADRRRRRSPTRPNPVTPTLGSG